MRKVRRCRTVNGAVHEAAAILRGHLLVEHEAQIPRAIKRRIATRQVRLAHADVHVAEFGRRNARRRWRRGRAGATAPRGDALGEDLLGVLAPRVERTAHLRASMSS